MQSVGHRRRYSSQGIYCNQTATHRKVRNRKKKLRQRIVSLKDKLHRLAKQERYASTSEKFFKGLCFESAGVVLNKHGEFISTSEVVDICTRISPIIKTHPEWLYTIGRTVFKNSFLSKHPHVQKNYERLFGQSWKKIRFRNLVRIGGDVLNTDIASVKNPVLTGALWYHYHPSQAEGPQQENQG